MGPLIPKPWVTFLAVALTCGMFYNIWLDANSTEYGGGQTTIVLAVLIAGILGFDLGRWFKGGGGGGA